MWITQRFPFFAFLLQYFYSDLYALQASHYSLDLGNWATDDLIITVPQGTS